MKKIKILLFTLGALMSLTSCYKEVLEITEPDENDLEGAGLADWTTETHSNDVAPDYDVVFPQDKVQRLDIVITAADWADMQSDLANVQSSGGGPGNFSDEKPSYFKCQVYHDNKQWYDVGIRYKGNSSLQTAYRTGNGKKPLRFQFDEFEDEIPEINNQRFYGFKELSMSSNYDDASLMREKTACQLFREFGVPAPHAAYYEVYIDNGNGSEYYGLYTMVEVVFNTMLEKSFGSESGNCYKPDGDGAAWATSGFSLADFEKKTNEDLSDWSDIQNAYDALHQANRTTNASAWRSNFDSLFDVDGYLKYLAANTTIQNWDTYGRMTHNYYLYHDPSDDLIKWIPWDNNEAFQNGKRGGALSYEFSEITDSQWPLIGYIMSDDTYRSKFDSYVQDFINNVFEPSKMESYYNSQLDLLSESASKERSGYTYINGNFESSVNTLINHCTQRNTAAESYLK
ncbi:MAG: CotH kinase family protein [Bacteroidia bacterium]